jgi:hypothetical protein
MQLSSPTSVRGWKWLFLILETFVVLACLYGLALRLAWPYAVGEHPRTLAAYETLSPWLMPMLGTFFAALLILLIASPFFLNSLRSVALRVWIVGAASVFCFLFLWLVWR